MYTYQKQNKSTLNNEKLRNVAAVLMFLITTAPSNGYAYRHTLIRDTHDMVIQTTRARHDAATFAGQLLENAVIQSRRTLLTRPGFLMHAKRNAEDFCAFIKRSIRDGYVDFKRNIRDAYVSTKREIEDLLD